MTGDPNDEGVRPTDEPRPDWESIAREELAASLRRQHRALLEEVTDLADAVAAGNPIPVERIEAIRGQQLECDEQLADALARIGEVDPDSPAERLEDERRRTARRLHRWSIGVRRGNLEPERVERLLESERVGTIFESEFPSPER